MKSFIVLGGPEELIPTCIFAEIKKSRQELAAICVIGVDHGNMVLLKNDIVPDVSVGDYDSLSLIEKKRLESSVKDIRYAIPEKDFTDSEFGISVALEDYQSDEIIVVGATGGRIDHFLVNLFSLLKPEFRRAADKIKLIDNQNIIEFYNPGSWMINKRKGYKYLAFVNLTAISGFNILDAKYPLKDYSVDYPVSWASNEFIHDQVSFNFATGFMAVIYSKDKL